MISIQFKMYPLQSWLEERVYNNSIQGKEFGYISLGIKMAQYKEGEVAKDSLCVALLKFTTSRFDILL